MIEDFKIYSISDEYIDYLRKKIPNVYSNKVENRVHTRKYVGIVLKIEGYSYYIPMSSPKSSDYQEVGDKKIIKKSIIPIIRIVVTNNKGVKELKATLRISHMIPVPEKELILYNLDDEIDKEYKDLVKNEIIYIRKNKGKIMNNAKLMYKQKINEDNTAGYVKSALDYKLLEILCEEYLKERENDKATETNKT